MKSPHFDAQYRRRLKPARRRWCYAYSPSMYEVAGCPCGNMDVQWSEWRGMLWCEKCHKDFVPEHNGVFDGPIPMKCAEMMGIRFDRINLRTRRLVRQEEYLTV